MTGLTAFHGNKGGGDDRPLPEIIADQYGFKLAHVDEFDIRYYAVRDWVCGVARIEDPRGMIAQMKRRAPQVFTSCQQLPYYAANGKKYAMDYATAETLYAITQRISANTGLRNDILAFLAKAGVLADDIRRNPSAALEAGVTLLQIEGKDHTWIAARAQGAVARNHFTAALKAAVADMTSRDFATATNDLYKGLWERTAAELKAEMGLKPTASLRDHQSLTALGYQMIAEGIIAERLGATRIDQPLPIRVAQDIIRQVAEEIGEQAARTSRLLGRDIATNRPLLPGGKEDKS